MGVFGIYREGLTGKPVLLTPLYSTMSLALDAVQSWIDRTNVWAIVTGYKFEVKY